MSLQILPLKDQGTIMTTSTPAEAPVDAIHDTSTASGSTACPQHLSQNSTKNVHHTESTTPHGNRSQEPQVLRLLCKQAPKSSNNTGHSFILGLRLITAQHNNPPGKLKKHRAVPAPQHFSYTSMKSCSPCTFFHLHSECQALAFPSTQACTPRKI